MKKLIGLGVLLVVLLTFPLFIIGLFIGILIPVLLKRQKNNQKFLPKL